MIPMTMKRNTKRTQGMTLIETTLIIALSMMVGVMILMHMSAHSTIMIKARQARFLTEEAPVVGLILAKTVSNSEDFRIYPSRTQAIGDSGSTTTGGAAIRLLLRQPTGQPFGLVIAYESVNGVQGLYVYQQDPASLSWPSAPSWSVTTTPLAAVDFSNNTGVLLMKMTGIFGEEITYAAEKH